MTTFFLILNKIYLLIRSNFSWGLVFVTLILFSCSGEDFSLELRADPQESATVGESIKVIADGSFSDADVKWFANGNKQDACNNQTSCDFTSDTATSVTVEVKISPGTSDTNSLVGVASAVGGVTAVTGSSSTPDDLSKTITLSWTEAEEEETTTTTTTTAAPTTTVQATNGTVTLTSSLSNVSAGSLVIRLTGSGLPTSGLTATITGESCGAWDNVFSFTQTSTEVLLDAPFDCLSITISTVNQIVFNQAMNQGTTVTVQQDNFDGSYTTLTTGTL